MADNNGRYVSTGFSPISLMDTRTARGGSHPMAAVFANIQDVGTMRAYLSAQNPGTFTTQRLNTMTANDMLYAIRQINGGIK